MNEIIQNDTGGLVAESKVKSPQIMDLVSHAVQHGQMEIVTQLLAIRNSEEDRNAEKAFNTAYSKMQADMPIITKRGKGHNGITYSRIEDIMQAVMPVLARYGLSLRHKTDNSDGRIQVTAILAHVDGHSETDTIYSGADKTGSKNDIQAIKSAITYMRRTTAENILGLASHGEDDDAFSVGIGEIAVPLIEMIDQSKTVDDLDLMHAEIVKETKLSPSDRKTVIGAFSVRRKALLRLEGGA